MVVVLAQAIDILQRMGLVPCVLFLDVFLVLKMGCVLPALLTLIFSMEVVSAETNIFSTDQHAYHVQIYLILAVLAVTLTPVLLVQRTILITDLSASALIHLILCLMHDALGVIKSQCTAYSVPTSHVWPAPLDMN